MDQPDRPRTARDFALEAAKAEQPPRDPAAEQDFLIDSTLRLVGELSTQSTPSDPTDIHADQGSRSGLAESNSQMLLGGPIEVDAGTSREGNASGALPGVAANVELVRAAFDTESSSIDVPSAPFDDATIEPIIASPSSWSESASQTMAAQSTAFGTPSLEAAGLPSMVHSIDTAPLPAAAQVAAVSAGSLPLAMRDQSNPSGTAARSEPAKLAPRNLLHVPLGPERIERGLDDASQNVHSSSVFAWGGPPSSTVPPASASSHPAGQGAAVPGPSSGPPTIRPILVVELSETQKRQLVDEVLADSLARDEKLTTDRASQIVHDEFWKRGCEERALWGH